MVSVQSCCVAVVQQVNLSCGVGVVILERAMVAPSFLYRANMEWGDVVMDGMLPQLPPVVGGRSNGVVVERMKWRMHMLEEVPLVDEQLKLVPLQPFCLEGRLVVPMKACRRRLASCALAWSINGGLLEYWVNEKVAHVQVGKW